LELLGRRHVDLDLSARRRQRQVAVSVDHRG
jgi:hypothetical protein